MLGIRITPTQEATKVIPDHLRLDLEHSSVLVPRQQSDLEDLIKLYPRCQAYSPLKLSVEEAYYLSQRIHKPISTDTRAATFDPSSVRETCKTLNLSFTKKRNTVYLIKGKSRDEFDGRSHGSVAHVMQPNFSDQSCTAIIRNEDPSDSFHWIQPSSSVTFRSDVSKRIIVIIDRERRVFELPGGHAIDLRVDNLLIFRIEAVEKVKETFTIVSWDCHDIKQETNWLRQTKLGLQKSRELEHCEPVPESALEDPQALEAKHVHEVYDNIARHFSHTRYRPWPRIRDFLQKHTHPGSVVVDLGCGNGKYSQSIHPSALWIGSDLSSNLLIEAREFSKKDEIYFMKENDYEKFHISKEDVNAATSDVNVANSDVTPSHTHTSVSKPVELVRSDLMSSSLKSNIADICIAIAVLHHISTRERRVAAIEEMVRVTKPGGLVLIYVWAKRQDQKSIGARHFDTQDVFVPWCMEQSSQGDTPNNKGDITGDTALRFYHVFEENEILEECKLARGCVVQTHYFDSNNWAVIIQKS